ncbi:MAG: phosphatase PAP2 family protein [Phycisphaerae bacterium]
MSQSEVEIPALWRHPAPVHFDSQWPRWAKFLVVFMALAIAFVIDKPVAHWALGNPITFKSDINLEMIMLMQWGQWTCSVLVILAVALLDKKGRRRAIALAIGCLSAVALCYLTKGLCGRARPWILTEGKYGFYGPAYGFASAAYQSFPSAHTSGAFALAAGLSWFYPRGRALFYGLALDVAFQRVFRHDHYPSDVIAGGLLAVTIVRSVLAKSWPGRFIAALPKPWQRWIFTANNVE